MLRNILAQQLHNPDKADTLSQWAKKSFAIAGTGEQAPESMFEKRFHFARPCAGLWGQSMERLLLVAYKSSINHSVEPCTAASQDARRIF